MTMKSKDTGGQKTCENENQSVSKTKVKSKDTRGQKVCENENQKINAKIVDRLPGEYKPCKSYDSVTDIEKRGTEFIGIPQFD